MGQLTFVCLLDGSFSELSRQDTLPGPTLAFGTPSPRLLLLLGHNHRTLGCPLSRSALLSLVLLSRFTLPWHMRHHIQFPQSASVSPSLLSLWVAVTILSVLQCVFHIVDSHLWFRIWAYSITILQWTFLHMLRSLVKPFKIQLRLTPPALSLCHVKPCTDNIPQPRVYV